MSITRPIAEHARRLPDEPALIFEGRKTTRRDLDQLVARLASFIANKTPRDGVVALDLPNGPVLAVLFLATATASRNASILDHEWPVATIRKVISASKPALVITSRPELEGRGLIIDGNTPIEKLADTLGAPADIRRLTDPDAETIFYTGFTSGSTAVPKGFRRAHKSWLASFAGMQQEFEIGPNDCIFALGPLSHSMPLYALASALHAGAKFIVARGFQAHSALRTIGTQRATVLYAVPAQLLLMIEAAEADNTICHGVRLVLSSGSKWPSKLSVRLKKLFPKAVFAEFYGASELSFVTLARSDERAPKTSVGRPFPGVTVTVRDAKGKPCPPGRPGLVFAESQLVFSGYTNAENDILREGDALSVGDRGHFDKNGFLYLDGRADRLVITSGRNIQPEEVEAVLGLHPAIAASAVFGVSEPKRGARLVAMVQFRPDANPRAADLTKHLKKLLPAYKIPRRFATVKKWPLTRLGKTDFGKLQKMWEQNKREALE